MSSLRPSGVAPDQHEDALLLVLEPRFEMDAVGPDIDIALGRKVALAPERVVVLPGVLQAADRRRRKPGRVLAQQRRQRVGQVAGRDALEIQDRQQRLDRLRSSRVGRQDRRREADAPGIVGRRRPVAHAWLAHAHRADAGHHRALGQVAVAHHAPMAVGGLEIGVLGKEPLDLGLHRLGEKGLRPASQDVGELVAESSWLNQLENGIVGHGISLLRWRSGGVKHPHDMPPSRFAPSPTFGVSSRIAGQNSCRRGLPQR